MKRSWISAVLSVLLLATVLLPAAAADRVVRVYNWSDYIDEAILKDFEAETGIKVIYDVYDSNDILETKLLAGKSGYDVVFPSGNFLSRQIQAGVFQKLDRSALPNWKNLDPSIMQLVTRYDPGNDYGVPYMWGTTGIAFNEEAVQKRLPDQKIDSWRFVFEPELLKKLADCGVYMLDAADEIIPAALNFIGENPDSKDPAVIEKAEAVLKAIKPSIRKFHSSENINALANGDICFAVMWSGDANIARTRAEEANKTFVIKYIIPKEGAQLWFDMMAMPKDAPHPKEGLEFINYMMRPEVIAKATNYVTYANANAASKPLVNKDILDDPNIYPPPEVMKRLFVVTPYDQKLQRLVTRIWQRVKTAS
ncbi:MAG: polyamine ABC transporter substrate-binding protein [Rhodospirillales bacterium]|nr:polyamine ABC transporter substrate-binding protein [Rhodospirillales bacterium]